MNQLFWSQLHTTASLLTVTGKRQQGNQQQLSYFEKLNEEKMLTLPDDVKVQ